MCAETIGTTVALFYGLLLSSSSSSISSSYSSNIAFILLWPLVRLVLVVVLQVVWRLLLVGSLFVGLVRGWGRVLIRSRGRLLVRSRGGCKCWASLLLISMIFLIGLRSVVQLILQVSYFKGKVLEHVLHVRIFFSCLG